MSVQHTTHRCQCGELATVTATVSPYEFDVICSHCQRTSTLSWKHDQPPPQLLPDKAPRRPLRTED